MSTRHISAKLVVGVLLFIIGIVISILVAVYTMHISNILSTCAFDYTLYPCISIHGEVTRELILLSYVPIVSIVLLIIGLVLINKGVKNSSKIGIINGLCIAFIMLYTVFTFCYIYMNLPVYATLIAPAVFEGKKNFQAVFTPLAEKYNVSLDELTNLMFISGIYRKCIVKHYFGDVYSISLPCLKREVTKLINNLKTRKLWLPSCLDLADSWSSYLYCVKQIYNTSS